MPLKEPIKTRRLWDSKFISGHQQTRPAHVVLHAVSHANPSAAIKEPNHTILQLPSKNLIRGVAVRWTGVNMFTPLCPEGVPEIDADLPSLDSGCVKGIGTAYP